MLDAPGRHEGDLGARMPRDGGEHFLQRIQRPREREQHQRCAFQQLGTQGQVQVFTGKLRQQRGGVRIDGPCPGECILVHADTAHPGIQRAEDQRAVVVAQNGHAARLGGPSGLGRQIQQQPVGGVDRVQVFGLHVGGAAQQFKIEAQRTSTHSVPRSRARVAPALSVARRSSNAASSFASSFNATRSVARRGP